MNKGLPETGRTSNIFPAAGQTGAGWSRIWVVFPAVLILIAPAFINFPVNAQDLTEEPAAADTLTTGDFPEEEISGSELTDTGHAGSGFEDLVKDYIAGRSRNLEILKTVMGFMGVPYSRYGTDSAGFDCSGFTLRIFREVCGILMPHSSRAQYKQGKRVKRGEIRFGDLVFFTLRGRYPSHVGIYIGDGLFAHASIKKGVTVSLLDSKYYVKRYFGACRVLD